MVGLSRYQHFIEILVSKPDWVTCGVAFRERELDPLGQALVRLLRIEWAGLRCVSVFILKSKNQPRLRWQEAPAHGREFTSNCRYGCKRLAEAVHQTRFRCVGITSRTMVKALGY